MSNMKLQKVPIPKIQRTPREAIYPFATMEVGEMFFAEGKDTSFSAYASARGRDLGRKFTTRSTIMRKTRTGWKVCEPDEKGAVHGVGVWRVA